MNVVRYRRCLRFGAKSSISQSLFGSEHGLPPEPLVGGPGRSIIFASIFEDAEASCAEMPSSFVSSDMPMTGVSNCGIRAMVRILMEDKTTCAKETKENKTKQIKK